MVDAGGSPGQSMTVAFWVYTLSRCGEVPSTAIGKEQWGQPIGRRMKTEDMLDTQFEVDWEQTARAVKFLSPMRTA